MTEQVISKKWYSLRVINGSEKKIKKTIDSEILKHNLQDYVEQVLVPTEKVVHLRQGKKVEVERSYYSGYILIEANLIGEVRHVIKNTPGVQGFVGIKDEPSVLRMDEVNRILGRMEEIAKKADSPSNLYIVGDSINIVDGPFANFVGDIEEINEEKRRLKISVKIFGRKTPIELSFEQVVKTK